MNKKAKKLGCQKVEVSNPHGLSYAQKGWLKETCSTKDMALIAKAFYKNKELRNIISTPSYTFESNQYCKFILYEFLNGAPSSPLRQDSACKK